MYLKKLKIGKVELQNNLILAPMAGVTDLPFRTIVEKFNPGLVCTEMVSSKALFYGDEKTKQLLKCDGEKRPISMQIFGSDPETMGFAAKYVSKLADIVDINMGCPAPKVVKNGDGSKLLLDLNKVEEIVKSVVANSEVPVTLKYRKGWDNNNIVACEVAKIAEKNGISAITIHGRTRDEFYSGRADLDIIKEVKESVNIPVIGNGDVNSIESAIKMFEYTGVDAIMIGRGALGNPWLIKQLVTYFDTGIILEKPSYKEIIDMCRKHLNYLLELKSEKISVLEMRSHISWYIKGLPKSTESKKELFTISDAQGIIDLLDRYQDILDNEGI